MKSFKFMNEDLFVEVTTYAAGGTAIRILDGFALPYAVLTVWLDSTKDLGEGEFYVKTWSENSDIAEAALASGIFIDTGKRKDLGFVQAQVWKFATSSED